MGWLAARVHPRQDRATSIAIGDGNYYGPLLSLFRRNLVAGFANQLDCGISHRQPKDGQSGAPLQQHPRLWNTIFRIPRCGVSLHLGFCRNWASQSKLSSEGEHPSALLQVPGDQVGTPGRAAALAGDAKNPANT